MKNILVTGGAGYIGSHTVVQLIENGYHPIIIDDFRNADRTIIQRLEKIVNQSITYFDLDLCDYEKLSNCLSELQIDGVIHFAAYKYVGESIEQPLKYYYNNILSQLSIIKWVEENNIKHFLFSSSCTVYGEPKNVKEVDETMNANCSLSPYGQSKIVGEQLLKDIKRSGSKTNFLSLRYFNPIGAHTSGLIGDLPIGKPYNLMPYITQTALGIQKELKIFGSDYPTIDGTCVRDYIHVVDLAEAHVRGIEYLSKNYNDEVEFINVGTGRGTSVLEIVQFFEKITNIKLNWKFEDKRPGDVAEIFANPQKAKNKLNWEAKLTVEQAIKDAWNWEQNFRKNLV